MMRTPEYAVTLSPELFNHLTEEAARLEVSLEWLVAALVLETVGGECTAERA